MADSKAPAAEKIVNLDPAAILADGNIRFGLLPHRIDSMAESIIERGGIMQPVEVVKLDKHSNGHTHRLRVGFYRHAGALKLNTEQKAGVFVPAIVREDSDDKDRIAHQLTENNERENMSPMDVATAIERMQAAGYDKVAIRAAFKRPGGRKGLKLQPASPSFVNIHLSFLTLPKSVQAKIHDGRVGVATAMQLVKVPAEQREAILARAEETRLKAIDREEREGERDGKAEATEAEKAGKLTAAQAALTAAETALAGAKANREAKVKAQTAAKSVGVMEAKLGKSYGDWDGDAKKAYAEAIGAAKTDVRAADKALGDATRAQDKARRALEVVQGKPKAETPADEPKATKGKAKAPAKTPKVSPADVQKAAKEAGVQTAKPAPLTIADARKAAAELAASKFPKVKAIGSVIAKLLSGELTPKMAETDLTVLTGERGTKKA